VAIAFSLFYFEIEICFIEARMNIAGFMGASKSAGINARDFASSQEVWGNECSATKLLPSARIFKLCLCGLPE